MCSLALPLKGTLSMYMFCPFYHSISPLLPLNPIHKLNDVIKYRYSMFSDYWTWDGKKKSEGVQCDYVLLLLHIKYDDCIIANWMAKMIMGTPRFYKVRFVKSNEERDDDSLSFMGHQNDSRRLQTFTK